MKKIRFIPIIATVLIMIMIFGFSSQNREASSKLSSGLSEKILWLFPATHNMTDAQKRVAVLKVEARLRKIAHFIMYALLGLSAAFMFNGGKLRDRKFVLLVCVAVLSLVYASTDEAHQIFVSGRGPQVSDVALDTAGGIFGGGIFTLTEYIVMKKKNKTAKANKKEEEKENKADQDQDQDKDQDHTDQKNAENKISAK